MTPNIAVAGSKEIPSGDLWSHQLAVLGSPLQPTTTIPNGAGRLVVSQYHRRPARPEIHSPYLTARQAAVYLGISYSTFRKKAVRIRQQPGIRRYRREDLDEFASSLRSKRKR